MDLGYCDQDNNDNGAVDEIIFPIKGSSKESDHLAAIAEGADQLNEDDLVVQELPERQLANCNPISKAAVAVLVH